MPECVSMATQSVDLEKIRCHGIFAHHDPIFSLPLCAIAYAGSMLNPQRNFAPHIMAPAQLLKIVDPGALRVAQPALRSNVIPFPSQRISLPVSFVSESDDSARAQLRTLLHSSLGVYVTRTERVRDEQRVHFDIAPADLDFTLHTLISILPEATIGRISRQATRKETR
jgi:hypothetical protein